MEIFQASGKVNPGRLHHRLVPVPPQAPHHRQELGFRRLAGAVLRRLRPEQAEAVADAEDSAAAVAAAEVDSAAVAAASAAALVAQLRRCPSISSSPKTES